MLVSIGLQAQKDATIQVIDGQKFYVHTVETGNTIYGLSKLYNVSQETILKKNPEASTGLKLGQSLYIPVPENLKEDKWTNPIRMDGAHLIHKVMKGETLFGISKEYLVDVNTILELNPAANSGLSKGMELKIPVNKDEVDDLSHLSPAMEDSLIKHTVSAGETVYGIAKQYGVKEEDFKKVNNNFPEGLKAGQVVRIPLVDKTFIARTKPIEYPTVVMIEAPKSDKYIVGLMLPFNLASRDSTKIPTKENKLRGIALSMYRGAVLAADSLEKTGFNADLIVSDVNAASTAISLTKGGQLENASLIIGPLQRSSFEDLSKTLNPAKTHLVCPVPQSNKILLAHPNVSKVICSESSEIAAMAKHIRKKHSNANIILLNSGFTDDIRNVQLYTDLLNQEPAIAFSEHKAIGKSVGSISTKLSATKENIIIAASANEVLLADLITKLSMQNTDKYKINLYGMASWEEFKFLDSEQRNRFNVHIPAPSFADLNDPKVLDWYYLYREKFGTDPDQYAIIGYDIMMYYCSGLRDFGPSFAVHFDEINYDPLGINFNLKKTGIESGYENESAFVLRYRDFVLENVDYSE